LSGPYRIVLSDRAERELRSLEREPQVRIVTALRQLAADPRRNPRVKRLSARSGYRMRVGDCRVLFQIEDDRLTILVVQIGHRREVYR
jgi:mRNA interferase RelE/StbE